LETKKEGPVRFNPTKFGVPVANLILAFQISPAMSLIRSIKVLVLSAFIVMGVTPHRLAGIRKSAK
jgi:hypothetical protein